MTTHLHLVRKPALPTFDPTQADHHVPIPADALTLAYEDAPTTDTPHGLEDLRAHFSDQEGDLMRGGEGVPLFISLRDLAGSRSADVTPLVTLHYATTKAREVFTQWQASRPHRANVQLMTDGGAGCYLHMRLTTLPKG